MVVIVWLKELHLDFHLQIFIKWGKVLFIENITIHYKLIFADGIDVLFNGYSEIS